MSTVAVISRHARMYSIATRLSLEGHNVSFFTDPSLVESVFWKGDHSPKVFSEATGEAFDFYLIDSRGLGSLGATLSHERRNVLGGCRLSAKLEDADYKAKLLRCFFSVREGVENAESIRCLVSGIFDGEQWLNPQTVSVYQSRLMDGDRGPSLGVTGLSLSALSGRLALEAFPESFTQFLLSAKYKGFVTLSMKVDADGCSVEDIELGVTSATIPLWAEFAKVPLYELLFALSTNMIKDLPSMMRKGNPHVLGVRLTFLPPEDGLLDNLLTMSDYKHIWPDAGVAPPFINLGWVTARGADIQEARRRVYRTLSMAAPQSLVQYRGDIGHCLDRQYNQLLGWGWM